MVSGHGKYEKVAVDDNESDCSEHDKYKPGKNLLEDHNNVFFSQQLLLNMTYYDIIDNSELLL